MISTLKSYGACRRSSNRCNAKVAGSHGGGPRLRNGLFGIHSFDGGPESPDFMLDLLCCISISNFQTCSACSAGCTDSFPVAGT